MRKSDIHGHVNTMGKKCYVKMLLSCHLYTTSVQKLWLMGNVKSLQGPAFWKTMSPTLAAKWSREIRFIDLCKTLEQ